MKPHALRMLLVSGRALVLLVVALFGLGVAGSMSAEIRLAGVFSDQMVLQRDKPVRVWGWADAGEAVSVAFGDQQASATADAQGQWVATLEPMPASSDGRTLTVKGKASQIELADVLVGEVWVCGGQSNMAWTLRAARDADLELESANYPHIRFLRLDRLASGQPQADVPQSNPDQPATWQQAVPGPVANFTAVGYYFAVTLHRRLGVPVGIIDNSWGGTSAQHWCTRQTLDPIPAMESDLAAYDTAVKAWVDGGEQAGAQQRYDADVAAWERAAAAAREAGQTEPRKPNFNNYTDPRSKPAPATLYNSLVAPLANLSLRGVLFYQGENNAFGQAWKPFTWTYPAAIADWRATFGQPELPFGLVQIAGWSNRRTMEYDMNHHTNIVREIQHKVWQTTPNTGLIVTYDANSDGNIHPGGKRPVGERSARWALAEVYHITEAGSNRPLQWRGPVYTGHEITGDKIVVSFDPETAQGLRLDKDLDAGFYIAGQDRQFHIARAQVDAKAGTVTVWSDQVPEPQAVRYAVSNLPMGTLMNGKELPAYPFRTDTWPITPHQSTGAYHADRANPVVEGQ